VHFIIHQMIKIIEEVTSLNSGYKMNSRTIKMICYADDATIFAESENVLQRQLFKFYQISQ